MSTRPAPRHVVFACAACGSGDTWKAGWQYFRMFDGIVVVCSDRCADAQVDQWASLPMPQPRRHLTAAECRNGFHDDEIADKGYCSSCWTERAPVTPVERPGRTGRRR